MIAGQGGGPINPSDRTYRNLVSKKKFASFRVAVKETDLYIHAKGDYSKQAIESVLTCRGYIEAYIRRHPEFAGSLVPVPIAGMCHEVIQKMADAGQKAGVGPMAAVAGAVAEYVGCDLLHRTDEIIVENGGDLYIRSLDSVTVGIYAGDSPLSLAMGVRIPARTGPVALCTSAGTFGHSLSMGKADAVCVRSDSCTVADAAATAIGNRVSKKTDIAGAIEFGKTIDGVAGLLVIVDDALGAWGEMELVPLKGKKP